MATPRISIGSDKKENLAQMVERYKILAEPQSINQGLMFFTLHQDLKLYNMLKQDPTHPKDTGLLQESWVPPVRKIGGNVMELQTTPYFGMYKGSFQSSKFNVYVLNTATVGEQAVRKEGLHKHRKKKLSKRHNLKRYMPFVDERTKFYTKKLRVVRQGLNKDWKEFVSNYLYERYKIF